MPEITDTYLNELASAGEIELTTDVMCLWNRFSLAVTSGISTYTLPEGLLSIIDIRWKGKKIYPWSHKLAYELGMDTEPNDSASGQPFWYQTTGYGVGEINFFPTPNETITADDSNLNNTTGIRERVIVTCYRVADPSGTTFRLPDYLRRRINKYYINYRKYSREGQGQDTDVAAYFYERYQNAKAHLNQVMQEIPRSIVHSLVPPGLTRVGPTRAVLPSRFGVIVE